MKISVTKPTPEQIADISACPVWECEPSSFDWSYSSQETCLILEGEATVTFDGGSVSFKEGDYVVFPKGLSCVWHVSKRIKKHYRFG